MGSLWRPIAIACGAAFFTQAVAAAELTPSLTMDDARTALDAALQEAERLDAPGGTIAVVDGGGHLVLLHRIDGMAPATPPVAVGKARTAAIFRAPTGGFEQIINGGRAAMLNIDGFTPMQGGVQNASQ